MMQCESSVGYYFILDNIRGELVLFFCWALSLIFLGQFPHKGGYHSTLCNRGRMLVPVNNGVPYLEDAGLAGSMKTLVPGQRLPCGPLQTNIVPLSLSPPLGETTSPLMSPVPVDYHPWFYRICIPGFGDSKVPVVDYSGILLLGSLLGFGPFGIRAGPAQYSSIHSRAPLSY